MFSENHIKKLIINHSRRIEKLREQQALYGINTPPVILIEIEDIETKIEELRTELKKLENQVESSPQIISSDGIVWQHIGHAENLVAMSALNGKLFAATQGNKLWMREPVTHDIDWQHIGHAENLVAMSALNGKLFAATQGNKLWMREPVAHDTDWQYIGHAENIAGMAAIQGRLFAVTRRDHKLWTREPITHDTNWQHIGYADNNVITMTAIDNKQLIAVIKDNVLSICNPFDAKIIWDQVKQYGNNSRIAKIVAISSINEKLFAATQDNKLWVATFRNS